ncbi:MAG TPA: DegV family protein [Halanaerobiales bacterium]|nr:DegV family protein [Halanaerobiales bacterium]
MKIGILTDSTCDLPQDLINKYNIEFVPLTVRIGEEQYKDKTEITSKQFFKRIKQSEVMPSTSQPSAGEFELKYKEMAKDYDHIISVHLSSHLSGTIQSAKLAIEENLEDNITIIDSKTASMGLGFLVILAAKLVAKGLELEQIIKIIKNAREDIKIYLTVDDLSYLEKGGRINKAESFIGNLINLKPILKLDFNSTSVEPIDKVRGRKNTHKKLLEFVDNYLEKDLDVPGKFWFGLLYGKEDFAKKFKNKFMDKLDSSNVRYSYYENNVGPVIGSHTGPSVYGIILFKGGKYLDE